MTQKRLPESLTTLAYSRGEHLRRFLPLSTLHSHPIKKRLLGRCCTGLFAVLENRRKSTKLAIFTRKNSQKFSSLLTKKSKKTLLSYKPTNLQ